jgi:hypothetical protein
MHRIQPSPPALERRQLRIDRRFVGPDGVANGGYLAGLLLRELGGPVEVTLLRPTPLDHPLELRAPAAGRVELADAGGVLVRAVRAAPGIDAPAPVDFDRVLAASYDAPAQRHTPFPRCFVCGPERGAGDGLRLQSGVLAPGHVAAPWIPGPVFGDGRGLIDAAYVAAALDCPGGWALVSLGDRVRAPILLGRIWLRIDRPVSVGLPHVVVGMAAGVEGRKGTATTAVYDVRGNLCAAAKSIWLTIE